jgi:hypothetical protein
MKKKITVVTFNASAGLVYQRLHLPFRHLKNQYDFQFIDIDQIRHVDLFYTDCLVFCHPHSADFMYLAQAAKYQYGVPVVVDLDDLLMDLPIDHPESGKITGKSLFETLQLATEVVYSTPYLKMKLGHLNRKHSVIENSLCSSFKDYTQPKRPHKTVFTVGWTGGQSHRSDILYTFEKGLTEFLIANPDTRAHFHALCPQELQRKLGAQVYFDPKIVDYMDYHALVETFPFDVCLVGLIDHPFNHAKSDLRILDMALHDIAIIASPRSDFIKHTDKNICLYADDEDPNYMNWKDALQYAKDHPEVLSLIKANAKKYVLESRLSTHAASKWNEVLSKAIQQGKHLEDQSPLEVFPELDQLD